MMHEVMTQADCRGGWCYDYSLVGSPPRCPTRLIDNTTLKSAVVVSAVAVSVPAIVKMKNVDWKANLRADFVARDDQLFRSEKSNFN